MLSHTRGYVTSPTSRTCQSLIPNVRGASGMALAIPVALRRRAHMEHPHANHRCCCGEFARGRTGIVGCMDVGEHMPSIRAFFCEWYNTECPRRERVFFFLFLPCVSSSCIALFALRCAINHVYCRKLLCHCSRCRYRRRSVWF